MSSELSGRMLSVAQQHGIEPPNDLEDLVVLFGRGIGDRVIFNDLDSGLYRGIKERFDKDHVLAVLLSIIEVGELLDLAVERSFEAHKYVHELDQAAGNDSASRMIAHMKLDPEHMKNSVLLAIKGLRANLSKMSW